MEKFFILLFIVAINYFAISAVLTKTDQKYSPKPIVFPPNGYTYGSSESMVVFYEDEVQTGGGGAGFDQVEGISGRDAGVVIIIPASSTPELLESL